MSIVQPRNIVLELATIINQIKRDDKQKDRQPLGKRMTPDVYANYILKHKSS